MDRVTGPEGLDLLDEATVVGYVVDRGLAERDAVKGVTRLSGGVSNVVLRVETTTCAMVVKQALGRLNVKDDWYADRARAQHEAAALHLLSRITPQHVPRLLDSDSERCALVVEAAPMDWETWKPLLMAGQVDADVSRMLGELLCLWHRATYGDSLGEGLDAPESFHELRIHPYFEVAAERRPELARGIHRVMDEILSRSSCLVLGDFSPKNILVELHGPGVWAIDLEVAHRGDPTFDVAFMSTHLLLKSLHVASARRALLDCLTSFLDGYGDGPGCGDEAHLRSLVGALLVARVAGQSTAEYLTGAEKIEVLRVGTQLLDGNVRPASSLEGIVWAVP